MKKEILKERKSMIYILHLSLYSFFIKINNYLMKLMSYLKILYLKIFKIVFNPFSRDSFKKKVYISVIFTVKQYKYYSRIS